VGLGYLEPRPDDLDLALRRLYPPPRLLLEGMKDIDRARKADRVDGPIRIAVLIVDHLQDAPAAKTLERLGARMLAAVLRVIDRKAHDAADFIRKDRRSSRDDPIHTTGFRAVTPPPL